MSLEFRFGYGSSTSDFALLMLFAFLYKAIDVFDSVSGKPT
jgi:hypothetical protein